MRFDVIWSPLALQELAAVWLSADDQRAVTAASHRLDQRLAVDPLDEGESRDGSERITFEPPLVIFFRVLEDDRRVEVLSVWTSS